MSKTPTALLVHGGFVDGSGWQGVHDEHRRHDIDVRIEQNPTTLVHAEVITTKESSWRTHSIGTMACSTPMLLVRPRAT